MKTFTFIKYLTLLSVLSHYTFGQSGRIQGITIDEKEEALPFSNVQLLKAHDSTFVKGVPGSEEGIFLIENVPMGKFIVSVSMVGYKTAFSSVIEVKAENDFIKLFPITLQEDARLLQEIVIATEKPLYEQQIDRLVVNVQNSVVSAGSSVLDVLERSPGVGYDRQKNALNLNGKNGVVIMVNGKPSRLPISAFIQVLGGMNANNVEKIELISAPSASYDAEGNGGIINIILKENNDYGTSGSYSLSMGYGRFEKPGMSVNINHQSKNFNIFADYSILSNHLWQQFANSRTINHLDNHVATTSISDREAFLATQNARFGFDYEISPKTTIGAFFSGFSSRWKMDAINNILISENHEPVFRIGSHNQEVNHWQHIMGNINISHSFQKGQVLKLDIDRLYYFNRNPSSYINYYESPRDESAFSEEMNLDKTTPIQLWVAKLDYIREINTGSKLETGIKGTLSGLDNNVSLKNLIENDWVGNNEFSGKFKLKENIMAAYVNLHHQLQPGLNVQAGMRWEYTRTDLNDVEQEDMISRKYHNLFPGASLQKTFNSNSSIQASYSRRITRPTYNNLAPFVIFLDPFTYFSGNTVLRPAITDAVQASYRFMNNNSVSFQYSQDYNYIVPWQVRVAPETNQQFIHPDNINKVQTLSLSLNLPFIINSWWEMQNNILAARQGVDTEFEGENITMSSKYFHLNTSQAFKLFKDISLELTGSFQSATPTGFGIKKPNATINLGVQKKFSENKGALSLSVTDIFRTSNFTFNYNQPALNLHQEFTYLAEPRVVQLTFLRNLGNKNVKASFKRTTGSEEEQKRAPRS